MMFDSQSSSTHMDDSASNQSEWLLTFVLPNLRLSEPIEGDVLAIVPVSDERLGQEMERARNVRQLITAFHTNFKHRVEPSALLLRKNAPEQARSLDALTAFRNAVAICSIIQTSRNPYYGGIINGPSYSNYFDFYPVVPCPSGESFSCVTPAWSDFIFNTELDASINPILMNQGRLAHSMLDALLLNPILDQWNKLFLRQRRSTWSTRALFRSIHLAYQASSIPSSGNPTLFDDGTTIALWVSAFETLTHPGRGGYAGLTTVLDLLNTFPWKSARLRRRSFTIRIGGKMKKVNLSAKLYTELHTARNNFLHGNPISFSHLFPLKDRKSLTLVRLAPILYDVALSAYLQRIGYPQFDQMQHTVSIPGRSKLSDLEATLLSTRPAKDRQTILYSTLSYLYPPWDIKKQGPAVERYWHVTQPLASRTVHQTEHSTINRPSSQFESQLLRKYVEVIRRSRR